MCSLSKESSLPPPLEIRLRGRHPIHRTYRNAWGSFFPALPLVGLRSLTFKGVGEVSLYGGTVRLLHCQDISFENLTFSSPSLHPHRGLHISGASAWGGVQRVRLGNCTVRSPQIGLYLTGPTRVELHRCQVHAEVQGITVQEGAHLLIHHSHVNGGYMHNIICSGEGRVEVFGMGPKPPGAVYPFTFEGDSPLFAQEGNPSGRGSLLQDGGRILFHP